MIRPGFDWRGKIERLSLPKLPPVRMNVPKLPAVRRRGLAPGTVAVTVAGGGLRIVGMKRGTVDFWQHVPLPLELIEKGCVTDPERFGLLLRSILDESSLGGRVRWALPGTVGHGRVLPIKLAGATDPAAVVAREAAWVMPVTPDEHYLYWQPLEGDAAGHVFVLAVQKAAIDGVVRTCAVAQVRLEVIDLKPLALALAVARLEAIIADVEATSVDVAIVTQGLPVVLRSVHLGDDDGNGNAARDKLLGEVNIAIRLYNDTNPDLPLDPAAPIYLSGEQADESLARSVAFATKHPTTQPALPFPCPPGFPATRFMVNVGLFLKQG